MSNYLKTESDYVKNRKEYMKKKKIKDEKPNEKKKIEINLKINGNYNLEME